MPQKLVIHWFRRDLRLEDNTSLNAALNSGFPVLPIFIFDPNILDELPEDDARLTFIHGQLSGLKQQIEAQGGTLHTYYGTPKSVLESLAKEHQLEAIYTNRDYEPYARERDASIDSLLAAHEVAFKTFKDQVIMEPGEVLKPDGKPYTVYTPYMKKWRAGFKPDVLHTAQPNHFNWAKPEPQWVDLDDMGFKKSSIEVPPYRLNAELLGQYANSRDIPSINGTSLLSTHLRFGTVSIRQIVKLAIEANGDSFLNELIWREFFMQILWFFPHTTINSFKPKYDGIKWRNNEREFEAWKNGQTGYPMVDAGMRELNATGLMHNRVRMVVASFLCKHLLIDWRWGEAYFASKLLDFEQASNVGNWQWAAGSGCDAAPYFRIFNPTSQWEKFDKQSKYVSKWVPEYQDLHYARPIVDHKEARIRCLERYKAALA